MTNINERVVEKNTSNTFTDILERQLEEKIKTFESEGTDTISNFKIKSTLDVWAFMAIITLYLIITVLN